MIKKNDKGNQQSIARGDSVVYNDHSSGHPHLINIHRGRVQINVNIIIHCIYVSAINKSSPFADTNLRRCVIESSLSKSLCSDPT